MIIFFDNELMHYGTPHSGSTPHSGRYPWGSGESGNQRNKDLLDRIKDMEKTMTDEEIRKATGMTSSEIRALKSHMKNQQQQADINRAIRLKDKGMSTSEIAKKMNKPWSTIKNYLDEDFQRRVKERNSLGDVLKAEVEKKNYLDVGKGVELQLGISRTKLNHVVKELEQNGYKVQYLSVPQATNPHQNTSIKVLTKADVPWKEVNQNRDKIQSILDVYREDGEIKKKLPPVSIDPDRILIRYNEDGGKDKDGVIELKQGVPDISLGKDRYAQVRIAVADTHYLKGMAMYADDKDFPPGKDIIFNTNKHKGTPMMNMEDPDHQVLKSLKTNKQTGDVDVDNPFGAIVRQRDYQDEQGNMHRSPVNIVNNDEDWDKWSKNLASQFLSKQYVPVAKRQLDLTYDQKANEFVEISNLTNPVLKEKLMRSFADDCDSAAVHLKAAAFPRQATHVLLPLPNIKPNEIYAPNYEDGEEVVLIRYPHGGVFEIPRLVVNNKNPEAKKLLGNAAHAVGIHPSTAEQLSGADFDGDTAVVIPTRNLKIKTSKPLKELEGFDTKEAFPAYPGMPRVGPSTGFHKQAEMGKVTNLITDMQVKGAGDDKIARAVKYSMVVIDAEKHNLDWRRAYEECQIAALKKEFQGVASNGQLKGASTIISQAKSRTYAPERDPRYTIDPETGAKVWKYTEGTHNKKKKDGTYTEKEYPNTTKSTKMYETDDAYTLTSDGKGGVPIERVYADYANSLKALANQARKESLGIESTPYSPEARKIYKAEVQSLQYKLNQAIAHAPKERKAQLMASMTIAAKKKANPDMTAEEEKKMRSIAIADARSHLLGDNSKPRITEITDREWEAIQSGAVTKSMLSDIIDNADQDMIKKRAMPKTTRRQITPAMIAMAKAWSKSGASNAAIARRLGISASAVSKMLK
ncbi:MAG: helix-turn-helix domain-containing protein [Bacteroidota bacterium]|nr:helix-turn-helix domain-containing protein [Bacteroidota bacterium]